MNKLQLVKSFRMEQENPHIAAHKRAFPETRLTLYQMDLIEGTVKDERAWQSTIRFWAGNAFRGESVWKMLQYYEEQVQKFGMDAPPAETWQPDCTECSDVQQIWKDGAVHPCPKCKEAA